MIASISPDNALRASGRFMVTTNVWPWSSTRACGWSAAEGVWVMGSMVVRNKNVF
jgi:hypothetical protein